MFHKQPVYKPQTEIVSSLQRMGFVFRFFVFLEAMLMGKQLLDDAPAVYMSVGEH